MEHTRFVGLDIHKERISIAVAASGRSVAVEYLGEIANDPWCNQLAVRPSRHSAKTDAAIIPILNIYRKYFELKMAGFLFVTFYVAMAGAALIAGDDIRRSWCNSSNARVIETLCVPKTLFELMP